MVAAIVGLISMFLYGYLENTYVNYPRSPVALSNRIVPHEVKGIIVYITREQSQFVHLVTWVLIVSGGLIIISLFINLKWPLRRDR